MSDRKTDIAGAIVCLFGVSVFLFAMIQWQTTQYTNPKLGSNLYFLSFFSALWAAFMMGYILAKGKWAKLATSTGLSVSGVSIYQEARYHNLAWDNLEYISLIILCITFFAFYYFMDLYKKYVKYGR